MSNAAPTVTLDKAQTRPGNLAVDLQTSLTRVMRRMRVHRGEAGIRGPQFQVLTVLADMGPMSPSALAENERVKPPAMTRTVASLEEAGFVERQAHASDRRQVVIALTSAGLREVKETRRRRDEWLAQGLSKLTQAERETLASASQILRRLAAS